MQKKILESKIPNSKRSHRKNSLNTTKKESNKLLLPIIENRINIENNKKNLIEPSSLPKYINQIK